MGWDGMERAVVAGEAYPPGWAEYLRFRDDFANILDPRFYTIAWLDGEVWSGRIRLFSGADSAILATIKAYPTGALEAHVMAAAGELNELISSTIASVETWARSIGCICTVIESRPGWVKMMKASGYELYQTAIRKDF